MKRLLVLTAWFLMASPMAFAADGVCGCGEKAAENPQARGALACPLFEVDVNYWCCDYYEPDCFATPSVSFLNGQYDPVWECSPECQPASSLVQESPVERHVFEFKPERKQKVIPPGKPGAGLKPVPRVSDYLHNGQPLFVSFKHPFNQTETVITRVKKIEWELANAAGQPHPNYPTKTRFAAIEVASADVTGDPMRIEDFGYKTVVRFLKGTTGTAMHSVALDPDTVAPNPFVKLPSVVVWFRNGLFTQRN